MKKTINVSSFWSHITDNNYNLIQDKRRVEISLPSLSSPAFLVSILNKHLNLTIQMNENERPGA